MKTCHFDIPLLHPPQEKAASKLMDSAFKAAYYSFTNYRYLFFTLSSLKLAQLMDDPLIDHIPEPLFLHNHLL